MIKRLLSASLPLFCAVVALSVPVAHAATAPAIRVVVNRKVVWDGQCVVVTADAQTSHGKPVPDIKLRAWVNGQPWCASQTTLPSGVAHLLLPLPEVGANTISVRGDGLQSAAA